MSSCEKCQDFDLDIKIKSPIELQKVIRVIKANLLDNTIKMKSQNGIIFEELNDSGPWDDFLEYTFECSTCHRVFDFNAETYHGSGGLWKPR